MHKRIAAILTLAFFLLCTLNLSAQDSMPDEPVQMADGLRSSGKIYVVVAVVVTILGGVIAYLVNLDRKISRLEKGE